VTDLAALLLRGHWTRMVPQYSPSPWRILLSLVTDSPLLTLRRLETIVSTEFEQSVIPFLKRGIAVTSNRNNCCLCFYEWSEPCSVLFVPELDVFGTTAVNRRDAWRVKKPISQ
jgi:hypothetical protein